MEDSSRTDNRDASPLRDGSNPDSAPVINVGSSGVKSEVLMGEGSRTFTMRELLKELKEEDHNGSDGNKNADDSPSFSQDISHQQHIGHHDTSLDLINSINGVDEESLSHQRILAFSAKRYASAVERNPDDHDAYYNLALLLQKTADSINPGSGLPSKDAFLEEACKKYNEATRLCPTFYDAYYNWAIAIAERATLRGRTKAAEEFWKQAAENYEKAVQLNWNSPQALNNWGLALQELSVIVPVKEKPAIVRSAISKFRASMRLQFDFHRAVYNLGTVLYNLAEDKLSPDRQINAKEISPSELYSLSAFYTAAAHAFKPSHPVYHGALRLLRTKLPLPYLKVGYLKAPPATKPIAPHVDWARSQFALNHESLQQVTKGDKQLSQSPSGRFQGSPHADKLIKIDIPDIVSVSECADLTLPPGAGLCIDTIHGPVYLVADIWESVNGWVDAIRLVYTIVTRGKSDILAGIITG